MTTAEISPAAPPDPAPLDPAQLRPFEDSIDLIEHPEALRERAARDGYLFFRGLLDPEPVLALRRSVLSVLDRHGLRRDVDDEYSGRLDLDRLHQIPSEEMREDIGVSYQIYFELQQLPELHRLPHHQSLRRVYRALFGSEIFVHPRHIMRAMTPHPAMAPTPQHQDFPLVQGATDTWTAWIPIGDCELERGPIAVLRGSHHSGCLPITPGKGAGGVAAQLCAEETDWVGGAFALGDVLTFSSLTVHRGVPATVNDEVRVSMDVRYQRDSDVIDTRSLGNHSHHYWPEVYAGWSEADRDLMYYWDPEELSFSEWDASLIQPGARRIC